MSSQKPLDDKQLVAIQSRLELARQNIIREFDAHKINKTVQAQILKIPKIARFYEHGGVQIRKRYSTEPIKFSKPILKKTSTVAEHIELANKILKEEVEAVERELKLPYSVLITDNGKLYLLEEGKEKIIGLGSVGKVKFGVDPITAERVAIKIQHLDFHVPEALKEKAEEARIEKEVNLLRDQIVRDIGKSYNVYEYLGFNLNHYMLSPGRLKAIERENGEYIQDFAERLDVAQKMMMGIQTMHAQGIIHRDIKADNVMYNRKTKMVTIIDYGVAKKIPQGTDTLTLHRAGTYTHITPKLRSLKHGDFKKNTVIDLKKADLFAAGITLMEIFGGAVDVHGLQLSYRLPKLDENPLIVDKNPRIQAEKKKALKAIYRCIGNMVYEDPKAVATIEVSLGEKLLPDDKIQTAQDGVLKIQNIKKNLEKNIVRAFLEEFLENGKGQKGSVIVRAIDELISQFDNLRSSLIIDSFVLALQDMKMNIKADETLTREELNHQFFLGLLVAIKKLINNLMPMAQGEAKILHDSMAKELVSFGGLSATDFSNELLKLIATFYPEASPEFYSCTQVAIQSVKQAMHKFKETNKQADTSPLNNILKILEKNMPSVSSAMNLFDLDIKPIKDEMISQRLAVSRNIQKISTLVQERIAKYYPEPSNNPNIGVMVAYFTGKIIQSIISDLQDSQQNKKLVQELCLLTINSFRAPGSLEHFGLIRIERDEKSLKILHGPLTYDEILDFLSHNRETVIRPSGEQITTHDNIVKYFLEQLKFATLSPEQLHTLLGAFHRYLAGDLTDENIFKLPDNLFEDFILGQINKHFEILSKAGTDFDPKRFVFKSNEIFLRSKHLLPDDNAIVSKRLVAQVDIFLKKPIDHVLHLQSLSKQDEIDKYLAVLKNVGSLSLAEHVLPIVSQLKTKHTTHTVRSTYSIRTMQPVQNSIDEFLKGQLEIFRTRWVDASETQNVIWVQALHTQWKNAVEELKKQANNPVLQALITEIAQMTQRTQYVLEEPKLARSETHVNLTQQLTLINEHAMAHSLANTAEVMSAEYNSKEGQDVLKLIANLIQEAQTTQANVDLRVKQILQMGKSADLTPKDRADIQNALIQGSKDVPKLADDMERCQKAFRLETSDTKASGEIVDVAITNRPPTLILSSGAPGSKTPPTTPPQAPNPVSSTTIRFRRE